jgi:two-component system, NarL family, nitrate/nitrite response regulator NarL
MSGTPLVVTHPCALVRDALDRILAKAQFAPVHIFPTLDGTAESKLSAPSLCIWLLGVSECTKTTNDEVRRVVAANPSVRPVILATSHTPRDVMFALAAGAFGFLCQNIPAPQLIKSLELVVLGQTVIHPQSHLRAFAQMSFEPPHSARPPALALPASDTAGSVSRDPVGEVVRGLSRREVVILRTLVEGASNKIIARKLVITESTVKVHMKAILRKLRLQNRTQAALWARTHLDELASPHAAASSVAGRLVGASEPDAETKPVILRDEVHHHL